VFLNQFVCSYAALGIIRVKEIFYKKKPANFGLGSMLQAKAKTTI